MPQPALTLEKFLSNPLPPVKDNFPAGELALAAPCSSVFELTSPTRHALFKVVVRLESAKTLKPSSTVFPSLMTLPARPRLVRHVWTKTIQYGATSN